MDLGILQQMKERGEKIAVLTCYDATFAKLMEAAKVDVLLVGDSLGMVLQGEKDTLSVSIQDMVYHTRSVVAGAKNTIIMADMPFGSYEDSPDKALENARALIAAGAHIVKLEGGGSIVDIARHLVQHGIPVCAHLGFTPQSVKQLGGYKVQGRTDESAQQILSDAMAMDEADVDLLLLEMVPATLAGQITASTTVPTIGIGAGADCSGQVLVLQDILGIYTGPADVDPEDFKAPRFVRNFLAESSSIQQAIELYIKSVKNKDYPELKHSY